MVTLGWVMSGTGGLRKHKVRYDSDATSLLIPEFRLINVSFHDLSNTEVIPPHEFTYSPTGYFPNFPVIIQGDGQPWDIGNLYLVNRLSRTVKYESRSFRTVAGHILDYRRFLEDEELDFLYFPENDLLKVTHQYRRRLVDQISSGEIKRGTGRARINAVVGFYKDIMRFGLVKAEQFAHQPYETVWKYLSIESNFGISRILAIESHNLAIKAPKNKASTELINDGGLLRPLTIDQQEKLLFALLDSSREYQLMFYMALFTGARMQTVCTLQVRHIWAELDGDGDLRLPIGIGTGVDTKGGTNMTLIIPGWLVYDLRVYSRCAEAVKRRSRSFYGETDMNYLFLTSAGSEYYTSKMEISHRKDLNVDPRVSSADRVYGSIREGATIRQFITDTVLPRIRVDDPEYLKFRYHDLRASFGMNLLDAEIESRGVTQALEYVQQRMGHSSKDITLQYLNYRTNMKKKVKVQSEFERRLFKYVNTNFQLARGDDGQA
ncbi:site-specific integrase [Pseudomonas sp. SG-MS2]|uniref:site-specific integrase n=1 Tax=Pseudomonas sp. SG-MS2 TaxID=1914534 RepID=UPI001379D942|nr:site-specific integrase [Pseudomonas sp. SG-MS2]